MAHADAPGRFAALLATLALIGAVAFPLMAAAIWLFWDQFAPFAAANLPGVYDLTSLDAGARLTGFGLSMAGAAIQSYGLLGLRRTFLEAAQGRALSARAVEGFSVFAWVSLIMVFVGILQRAGLIAVISLSDPAYQGALSIQFGSRELGAAFMGLLLVFVAHVFAEGKKAKDENDAFL